MVKKITTSGKALLFLTIILGFLNMLGPIGIDMFLAGVPNIAEGLGSTPNRVIASISTVMLGNAVGQLVLGPASDRFGRKPIILLTLFLFAGAALASGLSPSIEYLIFWRFIQGLAISGGRILAAAVARDLFDREQLGKMMADILFVTSLAAIMFPIIGGQIAQYLPWQWLFWTMTLSGTLVFLLFKFFYQETIEQRNPKALWPNYLLTNWLATVQNPVFVRYVLCSSFSMAGFGAFLGTSPTVLRGAFGVSAVTYGFLYSIIAGFFLVATFIGGRFLLAIGQQRIIAIGVLIMLVGGIVLTALAIIDIRHPLAVIMPSAFFVLGLGLVFPQTNSLALQPFPQSAGTAASLMGFITNLFMAGVIIVLAAMTHTTALNLAIAILLSGFLSCVTYFFIIRPAEKKR
ncbi:MAG TPA: multidrug effflux MFS transporter [Rhodospirillales bacterium]|jgi:DHA1 family bicyclomycin/chloramphenicol resistance-like MFS transporter|nr:multidrug effflux MFS transporter [Rhodospirillales bacterium]HJO85718.1 multidrug effflux MFS transporter [Rhodospirillales bacterium]